MISKDDFKLNINKDGGDYPMPIAHQVMGLPMIDGVALGELLCPVRGCPEQENSVSEYQHLKYIRYGTAEPFSHDQPEQIVIAFNGECGHDWELVFETYKGRMVIQILNVENKAG